MANAKSCLEPAQVTCPPALPLECGTYCDFNLNIGIFFDGTDNNKERDIEALAQSNIARLSDAYRHHPLEGFFSVYIEGVGTASPEKFGTNGEDVREAAAGKGGQSRIIWGLLEVLNSVHSFVKNTKPMFKIEQMKTLCTNYWVKSENRSEWPVPIPSEEDKILKALGLKSGLVDYEKTREDFLKQCALKLSIQLKAPKTLPRLAGIYLDVFGFSRGAAQARVFTNWLHQYFLIDGKLFGIPAYVRMLGLMDTVASVGVTNANNGEGHWDWATAENLRIHPEVRNCVHYVALHEFRTVFPLDSICQGDVLPPKCYEHYYPGAHADVGGGYAPGAQGKAVRIVDGVPIPDDSKKLSQLPLNDMYQAARKACEYHSAGQPWLDVTPESETDENPLIAQFALDPEVRKTVAGYFTNCRIVKDLPIDRQLRAHGLMYLAWRHMVNTAEGFERLYSVRYAQAAGIIKYRDNLGNMKERNSLFYYRKGQEVFAKQIELVSRYLPIIDPEDRSARHNYNKNVTEIYNVIQTIKVPPEVGAFYDEMVHDSYAGFIEKLGGEFLRKQVEFEGYLRYRAVYLGNRTRENSMHVAPEARRA
ncbi:DUF2235 domain-containing protein [Collimonas sp. H4R21]|uniref:DUF2235 domain-containing protein n=1 Tax=Collimonas rhizosphaerae TaxID=3126357 RepID=A0ABU9PY86_9BURK